MLTGMYSAAAGMDAATARHEVAAQNIAFASQPGYRRTALRAETFRLAFDDLEADDPGPASTLGAAGPGVDFTPGALELTGRPLDVALQGDGFFVVEGPQGPLYTRSGRWLMSDTGTLVTVDGLPVRGRSGPIQIPPGTSAEELQIAADGSVQVSGRSLGRLEVVRFANPGQLERAGVSLFRAPPEAVADPAAATVVQGLLEQSNVQPVSELISLVVAARQYEAAQLALKSLHEAIGRNVQR